jgi:hypothetical protein
MTFSHLACRAAVEMDNARRGCETFDFRCTKLLVQWFRGMAQEQRRCHSFDLHSIFLPMAEAGTLPFAPEGDHIDTAIEAVELTAQWLGDIVTYLAISEPPNNPSIASLARDICLAISDQASVIEWDHHSPRRAIAA